MANQRSQCDALCSALDESLTKVNIWTDSMTGLHADLVNTRKAIAVELDEIFGYVTLLFT